MFGRCGQPRRERSRNWFSRQEVSLYLPGDRFSSFYHHLPDNSDNQSINQSRSINQMPGRQFSSFVWSSWQSTNGTGGELSKEDWMSEQMQICQVHTNISLILTSWSKCFSTRCRADCKNSMGFKELAIHTGSLHNTIGMALKRGMKKYSHLFCPFPRFCESKF